MHLAILQFDVRIRFIRMAGRCVGIASHARKRSPPIMGQLFRGDAAWEHRDLATPDR